MKKDYFPVRITFFMSMNCHCKYICLSKKIDVIFRLDDGTCYGHKAVLMARCEVMEAMFKGDFRESLAQMVSVCCKLIKSNGG